MALVVQKFGGTSVGSLSRIEAVAEQVIQAKQQGHQVVVVLSAMSGETNRLLGLAHQLDATPAPRELDMLLASGEQVSIALLCIALIKRGYPAISLLGHQAGVHTNNHFNHAQISHIETTRIEQALEQGQIVAIAGFQGVDAEGNVTTLGRGGSDTSAVAIAAALNAKECQIFTDVDGVYSVDPRRCKQAKRIKQLCYDEMLVLAELGAKVLQSRSVSYAMQHQLAVRVLSSFGQGEGTLVTNEQSIEAKLFKPVTGIAEQSEQLLVKLEQLTLEQYQKLLQLCQLQHILLDMLVLENVTPGINLTFVINQADRAKLTKLLQSELELNLAKNCQLIERQVKLSLVGVGLKSNVNVLPQVLLILSQNNIDVKLSASSDIHLSVIIDELALTRSIELLHQAFSLNL